MEALANNLHWILRDAGMPNTLFTQGWGEGRERKGREGEGRGGVSLESHWSMGTMKRCFVGDGWM